MVALTALLLPILLSAVLVFIVSSIIHMFTPWHKNDFKTLANEDAVRNALRPLGIAPGEYMAPKPASAQDMRSAEYKEKIKQGPNFMLTVFPPGPYSITPQLFQWFLFSVVVSVFAAYVACRALPAGAPYLSVFRFAGVTAFLGYAMAVWPQTIWYKHDLGTTIRQTIDGLIYGLLTAGVFGWLWP